MNSFHSSCWNTSTELLNKSCYKEFAYQSPSLVDTVILPSLIGIICLTGLVGNILIVFTILRSRKKTIPDIYICNLAVADLVHIIVMPFLIHQWTQGGEWMFGGPLCTIITSLDTCNQFACSAIMTVMSVDRYLALIQPFRLTNWRTRYKTVCINLGLWVASFILALPVWVYSKVIKFTDGVESCAFDLTSPDDVLCYNPTVPKHRAMKLTRMVLVLVAVFVLSSAPYHVLQLLNLQMKQPTLAFYVGYCLSICLSYANSSISPFLYILLSGNFRKRLPKVQRKVTEKKATVWKTP